jgi:hypothetical protein
MESRLNFFASDPFLSAAKVAYFTHRSLEPAYVRVGGRVFRFLVENGKKPISNFTFLDYQEPVEVQSGQKIIDRNTYVNHAVLDFITTEEWHANNFKAQGYGAAPTVVWKDFASYEAFLDFIKPRCGQQMKEDNRRKRRLAQDLGELQFTWNDQAEDVFPLTFRWKSAQLAAMGQPDPFAKREAWIFFEELRQKGALSAATLRAGERLVASWFGALWEGRFYGWIAAYDSALGKYSPGKQLLHLLLEESFKAKHLEFDFSLGDEPYKWNYATHVRKLGPVGTPPLARQLKLSATSLLEKSGVLRAARTLKRK